MLKFRNPGEGLQKVRYLYLSIQVLIMSGKAIMFLFGLILLFGLSFAWTDLGSGVCTCNSCADCRDALNNSANCSAEVRLTADIINESAICIPALENFTSKKFDCQGHTIDGALVPATWGIILIMQNGNTITNCTIGEFETAIDMQISNGNNLTYNTAYNNSNIGFKLSSSSGNRLVGNIAYNSSGEGDSGFSLSSDSDNNLLENNTAHNNNYGFAIARSTGNNFTNNTAYENGDGFFMVQGSNQRFTRNTARGNTKFGVSAVTISNFRFLGNEVYSNLNDGIAIIGSSNGNLLQNNTVHGNSWNGIRLDASSHNRVLDNDIYGNQEDGIILSSPSSTNNTFTNNTVHGNSQIGFNIASGYANFFLNNPAYGNQRGFRLYSSFNNAFTNNTAHSNSINGIELEFGSNYNNFTNSKVFNNTQYGIFIYNSTGTNLTDTHAYDNLAEVSVKAAATPQTVYFTNLTIDNPEGNYTNYTSLDISDTVSASSSYTIEWATNTLLPDQAISFEEKWVNISRQSGSVSIDLAIWHWEAWEEPLLPYAPEDFKLVKYNIASGWSYVNATPDTGGRTLSAYNMDPASDYGILQYIANTSILKIGQIALQPSPGGIVEFNITINNTGNITLDAVQVIDELPAGLTFDNAAPSPDVSADPVYTWNMGPFAPGASAVIYLNATVDYGYVSNDTPQLNLTNYVNVTATSNLTPDLFAESEANATVYYANVSAVKANIYPLPPSPGGIVVYQLDISNVGEVGLTTVSVVDTLPSEFAFNSTNTTPYTLAGSIINWTIGPIAPGETLTLLLNATVNPRTANGTYINQVHVDAQPLNGNNVTAYSEAAVGVNAPAVSVVKSANSYTFAVGQTKEFTLEITNTGQGNLTIWAQDTLPAELAYIAGEANPLPTLVVGQALYWDAIMNLTPGQTVNVTYNATAVGTAPTVQNNVTVIGVPPNGLNVSGNASVTLTPAPPSGGGKDGKSRDPLEIEAGMPSYAGEPVTVTVTSRGGPVRNAEVVIRVLYGKLYKYYFGNTNAEGQFEFIPEFEGTYRATAEKNSYADAQEYFEVLPARSCLEDSDCLPGYACVDYECIPPDCFSDSDCSFGYECIDYNCVKKATEEPKEEPSEIGGIGEEPLPEEEIESPPFPKPSEIVKEVLPFVEGIEPEQPREDPWGAVVREAWILLLVSIVLGLFYVLFYKRRKKKEQ